MEKKPFYTEVRTIEDDGETRHWIGPVIWADSFEEARLYLVQNRMEYCKIVGQAEDKISNTTNN